MIMEGIICKHCGEFLDGEAPGYERSCGCTQEDNNKTKPKFKNCLKKLLQKKNDSK